MGRTNTVGCGVGGRKEGEKMKFVIFAALIILASSLHASNRYLGNLQGAQIYFFDDERTYFGLYSPRGDHSPGIIYIDSNQDTMNMINTLKHELCHLQQDRERRPFNERECYLTARYLG